MPGAPMLLSDILIGHENSCLDMAALIVAHRSFFLLGNISVVFVSKHNGIYCAMI